MRIGTEDRQETFIIDEIMIKETIRIDTDQMVEKGEFHSVVEYNIDRIIEIALGIVRIIEMILGEEISEEI